MSRYIDADALKSTMLNTPVKAVDGVDFDAEWFTRIANTAVQFADMVENAPTVDAVPVEWIKNYIKRTEDNGNTFAAVQYEMMLWDYLADGERRSDEQQ